MVHYKLIYFESKGAAEAIRQTFILAGQEYEDVRYSFEDFPEHKSTFPFHQLPVLEVDGKQLAQSYAISRYVAKQFGFAGKTAWEEALVDSMADQYKDFINEIYPFIAVSVGGEGDLEALKEKLVVPASRKIYGFLSKFIDDSGSGFLVGDSVTWVDLMVAEYYASFGDITPFIAEEYPQIPAHMAKIHSIPAIAKWRAERPVTPY